MKYKNTRNSILIIGDRESVMPFGITRDFSSKDEDNMPGLDAAKRKGALVPYEGKDEPVEVAPSPRAVEWHTEMSSGKPVTKKLPGGGVVEYVVSDTDGCDAVAMSDPDTVTSLSGNRSSDYIEEGVSAKGYNKSKTPRNASEAFDAEIDAENLDANFDDEDTLAENESERDGILDVDEEISRDASQFLVKNGKSGSQPKDIRAMVEESVSKTVGDIAAANRPDYDDAELQAGAPAKVVDFLKQNFSSKKWAIAKESDAGFLNDVQKFTQSENVRSLITQRLSELEKPQQA